MLKRRIIFFSVLSLLIGSAATFLIFSLTARPVPPSGEPAPPMISPVASKTIESYPREVSEEGCRELYPVVCGDRRLLEDPTGGVEPDLKGEVEALRVYEKIIHQHPEWTSQQVDEALVQKIYTPARRRRLEEVYAWVLAAMKRFIERQPENMFSKRTKKVLIARLESTKLELPPPASIYSNEPELFTKHDVYYGTFPSGKRVIRVGGAYLLTARSRFNRIFTFAHELAHSIDPCEVSSFLLPRSASPYHALTACFRERGIIRVPATVPSCSHENPLIEVFSDWVAAEITAEAIEEMRPKLKVGEVLKAVVNSVRDLCSQDVEADIRSHPSPHIRVGLVFGSNPRIRALLGCQEAQPAPAHCTFGGN